MVNTGQVASRTVLSVTLPINICNSPVLPCVDITMISTPSSFEARVKRSFFISDNVICDDLRSLGARHLQGIAHTCLGHVGKIGGGENLLDLLHGASLWILSKLSLFYG